MKITIVGGGNIGTQFAVHCAEKGHDVIVYTSKPELFDGSLTIVDENGEITHAGKIRFATSSPEIGFRQADMILITLPATMMRSIAHIISEHTDTQTIIGVVPGNGGSECAFKACIERGNTFFGIERVPAIARLIQKGKSVRSTGYRAVLHVAALPGKDAKKCAAIIESIFDIKTDVIPSYLNLTMTPSNPILHTTRLRTIFRDWQEGMVYPSVPLFYEDWDDASSELLIACDAEVQQICRALPEMRLEYVKSLQDHYESHSIRAMTDKISSISAFRGLKTPAVRKGEGWVPDLISRYFTADFGYGLSIIQQIARFAETDTPQIDETMEWYRCIAEETDTFRYEGYGITDKNSFESFYSI